MTKSELLNNYGKTSDEEIKSLLDRIKILAKKINDDEYLETTPEHLESVKKNLRHTSFTFDMETSKTFFSGKPYKEIMVYVKSSSRFFFKPDIGEIFDQFTDEDKTEVKAIYTLDNDAYTVNDEGDHFVMPVQLFK